MYAMYASAWPMPTHDLADDRERAHLTAIREASLAEDLAAAGPRREPSSALERVRRAIGLTEPEPECVACPA